MQRDGLFDAPYYLAEYDDVASSGIDPVKHYFLSGAKELRNPREDFDSLYYMCRYDGVLFLGYANPLLHYYKKFYSKDLPENDPFDISAKNLLDFDLDFTYISHFPDVTIIIPFTGSPSFFTLVNSLFEYGVICSYQLLVPCLDSVDDEVLFLLAGKGADIVRCSSGKYVDLCNHALAHIKGKVTIFFDQDIMIKEGGVDILVNFLLKEKVVGIVGPAIMYGHGRIQEYGCTLLGTAGFVQNGALDSRDLIRWSYVRPVDFVSVRGLAVRSDLLRDLDGFCREYDELEAVSADFSLRALMSGFRVVCHPFVRIALPSMASFGERLFSEDDANRLGELIGKTLSWPENDGHDDLGADQSYRKSGKRLLVIDRTPKPDQDAGSKVIFTYMMLFHRLGLRVTFLADDLASDSRYTVDLQGNGIECLYTPEVASAGKYLSEHGARFDYVLLHRVHVAGKYINLVREWCPAANVIFLVADLHWLREERQARIENDTKKQAAAMKTKVLEKSLIRKSDVVVVHSEHEHDILRREIPAARVRTIPLLFDIPGSTTPYDAREGLLFLGGYEHKPNVDAVLVFLREVWPDVRRRLPGVTFYIIGSHVPDSIRRYDGRDHVRVVGYVELLDEYFNRCRLSVVPLRYGAGVKGKVGVSMSYGVPVVSTPIGVEGMSLRHGREVLVAELGPGFVDAVVRLYTNEQLWQQISGQGLRFVEENYSLEAGKKHLLDLIGNLSERFDFA